MTVRTFFHGLVNQLSACHLLQSRIPLTELLVGTGIQTEPGGEICSSADDCNGQLSLSIPLFEGL